ncbi:hypothetical protein ACHAWF_002012 [Thalassiosira exigua]
MDGNAGQRARARPGMNKKSSAPGMNLRRRPFDGDGSPPLAPPPPASDRRRAPSLVLVTLASNACCAAVAPVLPLEAARRGVPGRWISPVFVAFSVGSSVAPILVARRFEKRGTAVVMACGMAGMAAATWCLGRAFDAAAAFGEPEAEKAVAVGVGLLTAVQFFSGCSFAVISTGYYSIATSVFDDKGSAMSTIEAAVGTGFVVGPILGSLLYDEMGYRYAYSFLALVMMVVALFAWKVMVPMFKFDAKDDVSSSDFDLEAGTLVGQRPTSVRDRSKQPSTISLLRHPRMLVSAVTITWINVAWTFVEPVLAKRLDGFNVGPKCIGLLFSLPNVVYVPAVLLMRRCKGHHRVIVATSAMMTPVAVLLVASTNFSLAVMGIFLLGLLPTPVWVRLLPFMQEESAALFPEPDVKRWANDVTAG